MSLPQRVLDGLESFFRDHPELMAEAEKAGHAIAQAASTQFTFYDVVRELAKAAGIVGGPDAALAEKVIAAIGEHEAAHLHLLSQSPPPAPAPVPQTAPEA
jgi:hypothetical protein